MFRHTLMRTGLHWAGDSPIWMMSVAMKKHLMDDIGHILVIGLFRTVLSLTSDRCDWITNSLVRFFSPKKRRNRHVLSPCFPKKVIHFPSLEGLTKGFLGSPGRATRMHWDWCFQWKSAAVRTLALFHRLLGLRILLKTLKSLQFLVDTVLCVGGKSWCPTIVH